MLLPRALFAFSMLSLLACGASPASDGADSAEKPDDGAVFEGATAPSAFDANNPSALTISASFGQVEPFHFLSDDQKEVTSLVTMGPAPKFSPSTPTEMPNLADATRIEISSPSLGSCTGRLSWTLNPQQLGLTFFGTDVLPATDCAKFSDALAAQGLDAVMPDVAYPNGGTVRITLKLRP